MSSKKIMSALLPLSIACAPDTSLAPVCDQLGVSSLEEIRRVEDVTTGEVFDLTSRVANVTSLACETDSKPGAYVLNPQTTCMVPFIVDIDQDVSKVKLPAADSSECDSSPAFEQMLSLEFNRNEVNDSWPDALNDLLDESEKDGANTWILADDTGVVIGYNGEYVGYPLDTDNEAVLYTGLLYSDPETGDKAWVTDSNGFPLYDLEKY